MRLKEFLTKLKKKKKIPNKEEVGDGLRRQGRGSRGSSVLKNGISPMKEKLETPTLMKPIKNMKPASEKNGRYNSLSLSLLVVETKGAPSHYNKED